MNSLLAGVLIIFLSILLIPAYAMNPTNEWDFDLLEVQIYQELDHKPSLKIDVPVKYLGKVEHGTVNVIVKITNPDNSEYTHLGLITDMKQGEVKTTNFTHRLSVNGEYSVKMILTPPANFEDPGHIFDSNEHTIAVNLNETELNVNVISIDSDEMIIYRIEKPEDIDTNEIIRVATTLPSTNDFEKIVITNNDFLEEYSIDTKNIYIKSDLGYANMQVNLVKEGNLLPIVKEGNLLPIVNAQNELHNYVQFFTMHKNICYDKQCVYIDFIEVNQEFPLWVTIIMGAVIVSAAIVGSTLFFHRTQDTKLVRTIESLTNQVSLVKQQESKILNEISNKNTKIVEYTDLGITINNEKLDSQVPFQFLLEGVRYEIIKSENNDIELRMVN